MMRVTVVMLMTVIVLVCGVYGSEWIDEHSPTTRPRAIANSDYELVFSDEFDTEGRDFAFGKDKKWEAVDNHYSATGDDECYKPEAAETIDGSLRIRMTQEKTYDLQDNEYDYKSAMLMSWNKFCFTGGYMEVSAKLPGDPRKGGIWSAIWLLGNLGRAGYLKTTEGLWPYAYDQCDAGAKDQSMFPGTDLKGQRYSACDTNPDHGFKPLTGRGVPEIDLIELTVPTYPSEESPATYTSSLQMGPIIPLDTNHGAGLQGCEDYMECEGLYFNQSHQLKPKPTPWCTYIEDWGGNGHPDRANLYQDCLSSENTLKFSDWDGFLRFGMKWIPGERIAWYLNDEMYFEVTKESLSPKQSKEFEDYFVGQRDIPKEPMYPILNMATSNSNFIPRNPDVVFPVDFLVDYVRIYQDPNDSSQTLGCDPENYPTKTYIEENPDLFELPICGNGVCESGECTSCPEDCTQTRACAQRI